MQHALPSLRYWARSLSAIAALLLTGSPLTGPARAEPGGAKAKLCFELDVMPVLTAAGCNSGGCHGKSRGQNGFQLSILGFDSDADYAAIVEHDRGRRVFPSAPESSLLLLKASARLPHGGGVRLKPDSQNYDTLRSWIAAGMPRKLPSDPELVRIEVAPAERPLAPKSQTPLAVTAHYTDGSQRDVTQMCAFQSSEAAVASVDSSGRITAGALPGEATIMARYMGQIATWNAAIPWTGNVQSNEYARLPRRNFIDDLVWNKLQQLGITPSAPAGDSTFLRRAYLDVIGRLPRPDEARAFLADRSGDKRARLVDALLERPEYADFWANKWADLLRPNPYRVGIKATLNYDAWIRGSFRRNQPYDQFARELLTARGSTWSNGATVLFRDRRSPDEITTLVSQLFLGIRLECAKCHHHPFEVWGQDDFYGMAAFFARNAYKGQSLSPPISGGEEVIYSAAKGSVLHPLTGQQVEPKPLFGTSRQPAADEDPRRALAEWITADDNPYFAEVAVNRVWAELLGRGIVDPVDDLRATNPPSNRPLLAGLAAEFRRQHYDFKRLIRTIMTSHAYGLSSLHNGHNVSDTRNYSRHYRQRLRAEVLLDAVSDITGVPEAFAAMPSGSRAMELWTHRVESLFLDAFGRPDPNQDPPYQRTGETTMVQALHLMNAPHLHEKVVGDKGRAALLAASGASPREIVEELYLLVYSRLPTSAELAATTALYARPADRRRTTEDLLWALLNTPEFVFKD
jgi:hypothetical protein